MPRISAALAPEQRARAGGEILQPRAEREDEIGLRRERVRRAASGDADGADIQRDPRA